MFSWVEINKKNIFCNLKNFCQLVGENKFVIPVIKSNAYGHGIVEIAKLIKKSKLVKKIAVVNDAEAINLIKNKINSPILILSYWDYQNDEKLQFLAKNKVEFSVYKEFQIKKLASISKKIKIHLKIDTGTSRLGIKPEKTLYFIKLINKFNKNLIIENIFTHYADAEENKKYTEQQTKIIKKIREKYNIKCHAACSAATLVNEKNLLDGIRLGISLYGYWPSQKVEKIFKNKKFNFKLKPALTWKTKIIQVKNLEKNSYIGYGLTDKTKKKTKIAVLPIGYYEGYDRLLSNCGEVYIKGKKCPVRGRICMNLCMVDVSNIKNVKVGDEVELLGENITAESIAKKTNTINYEVISRINPLLPRVYK